MTVDKIGITLKPHCYLPTNHK